MPLRIFLAQRDNSRASSIITSAPNSQIFSTMKAPFWEKVNSIFSVSPNRKKKTHYYSPFEKEFQELLGLRHVRDSKES